MRSPIRLLIETPHYVFGRFRPVRATFSRLQYVRQRLDRGAAGLRIGEPYSPESRPLPVDESDFVSLNGASAEHLQRLTRDSYSEGLQLTESACQQIVEAASSLSLKTGSGEHVSYDELQREPGLRRRVAIATVPDSGGLDVIRSVAGDRRVVEIVSAYLGYLPTRVSPWLFWSPPNGLSDGEREAGSQTVRFHYDVHHYSFLYVNYYLLDTDENNGAHVLIAGSHRDKRLRHLLGSVKLSDEQARHDFAQQRFRVVSGRAGAGFFEDTSCFHKALAPRDRARLMLQLRYQ